MAEPQIGHSVCACDVRESCIYSIVQTYGRYASPAVIRGRIPFDGQLEEDDVHMLWLVNRNRRGSGRRQILLFAALKNGCWIVNATPAEQALLDAHGFGSGRVQ